MNEIPNTPETIKASMEKYQREQRIMNQIDQPQIGEVLFAKILTDEEIFKHGTNAVDATPVKSYQPLWHKLGVWTICGIWLFLLAYLVVLAIGWGFGPLSWLLQHVGTR